MIVSWSTAASLLALVADDGGASSAEVWRTISRVFNGILGALPIIFGLAVPVIGILAARQKAKAAVAAAAGTTAKRSQLSSFLNELLEKHAQAQQQTQQQSGQAAARAEAARRAREEAEEEERYWHQEESDVIPPRPIAKPAAKPAPAAPTPKAQRARKRGVLRRAIVLREVFGPPKSVAPQRA